MSQYVQHISGRGQRWKVRSEELHYCVTTCWQVENGDEGPAYLPKSEYRLCDPPERWVDVTTDCDIGVSTLLYCKGQLVCQSGGYRLRKVELSQQPVGLTPQWVFLVEHQEPDGGPR